jgi:hypothetical protein
MGHFIRDCHSRQSSSAYTGNTFRSTPPSTYVESAYSYMDTNKNDMKSVAPPTLTPCVNVASLKAQIDSLSPTDNDSLIEMMGAAQDFTPA